MPNAPENYIEMDKIMDITQIEKKRCFKIS